MLKLSFTLFGKLYIIDMAISLHLVDVYGEHTEESAINSSYIMILFFLGST